MDVSRSYSVLRVGRRWIAGVPLLLLLSAPGVSPLRAQTAQPPATPPSDWGPISINLEEIEYPHPVRFLEMELYDQVVRLAYMDVAPVGEPNGRAVVLLHGASYYGWYWRETIEALRNEGYRVIVKDRLGWGKSSKPLIPYSWALHAANTKALLDHLGIVRAAIVGHSMGGQMATRFARLYPEVTTHLVMVNPIGLTASATAGRWSEPRRRGGGEQDLEAVYQSNLRLEQRRVVEWKPEFLEHVRIRYGQALSGEWPRLQMVRALNQTGDTMVYDWPMIRTKALIIGGAQDGPNFAENAKRAAEQLPNGEVYLIPNAGHNPHLETPEVLSRELIRFLAS